ncbi:MAG: metalloregulator ArsR/SmtB family transcription factor [Alphaproteobacteria bacterium]|nr:metalloregulator ArsR/SmtB family transcription factor [Alphaproteobacteria bacterium]
MDIIDLAACLETLGHPTRLAAFRLLVRAGRGGLPVGALQRHLEVPASTLSHHLSHLVAAGLVRQTRDGRVLRCTADYARMDRILAALTAQCCAGVEGAEAGTAPAET